MILSLVNGQPSDALACSDRGLAYGDGVFRTLRMQAGAPLWLADHLARLAHDAQCLGLPAVAGHLWCEDIARLDAPAGDAVLKLVLTRGEAARGYRPGPAATPTRIVMLSPAPMRRDDAASVQARVCRVRVGHQPLLAGVKHLNRLENVLAQAEWDDPAIAEGVLLDQDGRLVGGTRSNVLLVRDGRLVTPALQRCGVAGVTRSRLLDAAHRAGIEVVQDDGLWLDDLLGADEVMFCNSVFGLWRVGSLNERVWRQPVLYPRLSEWLHGEAA